AAHRGDRASPWGRRGVPDRLSSPRRPRRHPGPPRSGRFPRAGRTPVAVPARGRRPSPGPRPPRECGGHRAGYASSLGPQGAAREGRTHRGSLLTGAGPPSVPPGMRRGSAYVAALRDGRTVFLDGERVLPVAGALRREAGVHGGAVPEAGG